VDEGNRLAWIGLTRCHESSPWCWVVNQRDVSREQHFTHELDIGEDSGIVHDRSTAHERGNIARHHERSTAREDRDTAHADRDTARELDRRSGRNPRGETQSPGLSKAEQERENQGLGGTRLL
jgi:hypothetical protein